MGDVPPAPTAYAPALGLDAGDGLLVSVDPATGEVTYAEVDLVDGDVVLTRARTSGRGRAGLFGAGWRTDAEARVVAQPGLDVFAVERAQGVVLFAPLPGVEPGTYVSLTGEVEVLRRTDEGWALLAAEGRLFLFAPTGEVLQVGAARVERGPGGLALVGGRGRIDLALDAAGRVVEARAGEATLAYGYQDDELVEVGGARTRRYEVDGARPVRRVLGGDGRVLVEAEHGDDARVARLTRGDGWTQGYAFASGDEADEAAVDTPLGRWTYRLEPTPDGATWTILGPAGREQAWFDDRGRLVARQRAGAPREVVAVRAHPPLPAEDGGVADEPAGDERADADAAGVGVTPTFDAQDRLVEARTPAGRTWRFGWEGRRVVRRDGPAGPLEDAHDAAGRLARRVDAAGGGWSIARDRDGRPVEVAARASADAVRFVWDDAGRLVGAGSSAGVLVFERDDAEDLVAVLTPAGVELFYEGDALVTPWGEWTRRADGGVERLGSPAGEVEVRRDAAGRVVALALPCGVVVETARDARRPPRAPRRAAGRDPARRPRGRARRRRRARGAAPGRPRDALLLDAAGRLAGLAREGEVVARWAHDPDGNRTLDARGGEAREEALDARGRLVARGDERLEHDAAGRLVAWRRASGVERLVWDGLGRLARVERAGRPPVDYAYDALGRLAVRTEGGAETRYVWDGERLLAEVGPGERVRLWAHGPGLDEPLAYWEGRRGEAPAAAAWTWLILDERHDAVAYLDARGALVDRAALDPWGVVEAAPAPGRPMLFAGRLVDPATGLVHLRARWYSPALGRFVSADPAGLAGGPSPWAYVDGRPHALIDPLGLSPTTAEDAGLLGRAWGAARSGSRAAWTRSWARPRAWPTCSRSRGTAPPRSARPRARRRPATSPPAGRPAVPSAPSTATRRA
ncbi:MAG: RHS repeat-associated core domain-containing protein [Planctomycetes bacterium]|nr:RHS repeat-associated core domain-containing protein [Planctomycetota bacterium]